MADVEVEIGRFVDHGANFFSPTFHVIRSVDVVRVVLEDGPRHANVSR